MQSQANGTKIKRRDRSAAETPLMTRLAAAFESRRQRRLIAKLRSEFEKCGFAVGHIDDKQIEKAFTNGQASLADIEVSAKSLYLASRRLAIMNERYPKLLKVTPAARGKVAVKLP